MIEEDEGSVKPVPGSAHYGEALLYDYSKYLTTISLLALGGVLSLSQAQGLEGVKPLNLGLAIGGIIIGGISAFSVSYDIVLARAGGKEPSGRVRTSMWVALAGIGLGLGAFINIYWNALT